MSSSNSTKHESSSIMNAEEGADISKKRQRTDHDHPGIGIVPPALPVATSSISAASATNNNNAAPSSSLLAPSSIQNAPAENENGSFNRISLSPHPTSTTMPNNRPPPPPTAAATTTGTPTSTSKTTTCMAGANTTTAAIAPTTTTDSGIVVEPSSSSSSTCSASSEEEDAPSGTAASTNSSSIHSSDSTTTSSNVIIMEGSSKKNANAVLVAIRHSFRRRFLAVLVIGSVLLLLGGVYAIQQHSVGAAIFAKAGHQLEMFMSSSSSSSSSSSNNGRFSPPTFMKRWMQPKQNKQESTTLTPAARHSRRQVTLRDFLTHSDGFSLALAPAFFGYYAYFGALAAWEDGISASLLRGGHDEDNERRLQHVAGASAGAMAAVLLSAGVAPQRAAAFCETITIPKFADFPGYLALFRGDKFERIMYDFLANEILLQQQDTTNRTKATMRTANENAESSSSSSMLLLQNARVPVAVTAFDLETMQTRVLTQGSMARAARASATFPFLFQPVGWVDDDNDVNGDDNSCTINTTSTTASEIRSEATLIDGGIRDTAGVDGLAAFVVKTADCHDSSHSSTQPRSSPPPPRRIVNLAVGGFLLDNAPGPGYISTADQVVSISLNGLPMCGPWPSGMANGPIAVQAAYRAMMAALDTPLVEYYDGRNEKEDDDSSSSGVVHYELQLDASAFWKA